MKFKAKYVMIHFKPVELYPPAQNFIDYIGKKTNENLLVITTGISRNNLKEFGAGLSNVNIARFSAIKPGSFLRIFSYLKFYIGSLLMLLKHKPSSVIYFESISCWPALMYKKIRGSKVHLMVHYHEYMSPAEYQGSMRLVRQMHRLEKQMYNNSFAWISHTNEKRLADFRKDNSLCGPGNFFFTMPNYPSMHWAAAFPKKENAANIKLVYVGALGFDNMYVKETLEWVRQHDDLTLDIYANIIDEKATQFIENIKCSRIAYHGAINYADIPAMLQQYDVGLVMYKPFNENTINAVSNKVFEYLACGLDVWFSKDMSYTLKYTREDTYPKVLPVDFKQLEAFDYRRAINKNDIPYLATAYYYENVYSEIYDKMAMSNE